MKWDLAHERWEVGDDDLKFGPVQSVKIPGPLQHTVGVICAPCNGGWIADLETEVRPILDDLRKTERVTLSRRHQHTLAAWSVLTAMVTEHTVPDLAIPAGDYHHLCKTGETPGRFMVWATAHNGPLWTLLWRKVSFNARPVFQGRSIAPTGDSDFKDSQTFCIFFGQLILLVFWTSSRLRVTVRPTTSQSLICIQPLDRPFKWPPHPVNTWPDAILLTDAIHNSLIAHTRRVR